MMRRWIFALFGSPRAVGVTLIYLLMVVVLRLLLHVMFGGDVTWGGEGGTRDEVILGVIFGLVMSPLLHPAMAVRGGDGPKTSEEAPAADT